MGMRNMEGAGMLLAHRNPIVVANLADEMRRRRAAARIRVAQDGEALMCAQCFHPARVVLVDAGFSQIDRILQCLCSDPAHPWLYICADGNDERALPEAVRQSGWPVGLKSTPVGATCDELERMLRADAAPGACEPIRARRRENAQRLLFLSGVMPVTKGSRYLRAALVMASENPALLCNLEGRLYPAVALRCGGTPAGVERCLRYAVQQIWPRMEPEERLRLLPRCGNRPGVKLFLSAMAERMNDGWLEDR